MNSVNLIGRAVKNPEQSYTNDGKCVAKFTLAVDNIKKDDTDFIRCVAFGKTAEVISRYITKGRQLGVNGRIKTGSYKNKDGQTVYTTDVIIERMTFCGGKSEKASDEPQPNAVAEDWDVGDSFEMATDDIPF